MFAAVLDTCVLWPATSRDFFLSLAVERIYRPLWSSAILAELQEHEEEKLLRLGRTCGMEATEAARRAARLISTMQQVFPDAAVQGWEPLEGTFGLPDVDDEHVLAAAARGGAGAIVTANLKDFPREFVPPEIDVVPPEEFALQQVEQNPVLALRAVKAMADRNLRDPNTVEGILNKLEQSYRMIEAAQILRAVHAKR